MKKVLRERITLMNGHLPYEFWSRNAAPHLHYDDWPLVETRLPEQYKASISRPLNDSEEACLHSHAFHYVCIDAPYASELKLAPLETCSCEQCEAWWRATDQYGDVEAEEKLRAQLVAEHEAKAIADAQKRTRAAKRRAAKRKKALKKLHEKRVAEGRRPAK